MKKILAILLSLLTLLSCGLLSACSAEKTQPDTLDTETVWETVSEAYIYAFPLVLTDGKINGHRTALLIFASAAALLALFGAVGMTLAAQKK